MDRRGPLWLLPGLAIGGGLLLAALVATGTGPTASHLPGLTFSGLATFAALVLVLRRARALQGRERAGWCCLGATVVSWQLGSWVVTPVATELFLYAGYAFFAASLPLIALPSRRSADQRWFLDATIVVVAAGIVCVETLMRPLTDTSDESRLTAVVAMSVPLLDLGLLAALVFSMYAGGRVARHTFILALAIGARLVSDFVHLYAAAYFGYERSFGSMDIGWTASVLLIGLAAYLADDQVEDDEGRREPARWGFVMPYVAVVVLTSVTIGASLYGPPSPALIIGAGVAIALAAVRQTATTFEHLRIYHELQRSLSVEREAARKDPLTGTLNHGAISAALADAVTSRDAQATTHAIVMVDIDGLKATNDTFGHQAGDLLLITAANALQRPGVIVGRYAGDEFAVLIPGAGRNLAERYVADVSAALAAADLRDATTSAHMPVRASMGIAIFPDEAETVPDLIKLADSAMYVSKRSHHDGEESSPSFGRRRDDAAVRLVSELIPLLASPGDLDEKLALIGSRLSAACSYDGVRTVIFGAHGTPPVITSLVGRGTGGADGPASDARVLEDLPLRLLLEQTRRPIIIDDMASDERLSQVFRETMNRFGVRAALVAPMLWHDQVIGSIGAGRLEPASFTPKDAQLLATIAGQITAIVRMASMVESLQETSERVHQAQAETVMMLAAVAEAHDRTTGLHLVSIRKLTESLAAELGYEEQRAYDLGLAAVLHDIGKVSVPERLLSSAGRLAGDQWEVMKQHTIWGEEFLNNRPGFELAAMVARSHHERWDGAGYPDGLAGEEIPDAAAIVTVSDSFDAMTDDRPYRAGLTVHQALAEIVANRATQFSPRVVDALLALHERGLLDGTSHGRRTQEAA